MLFSIQSAPSYTESTNYLSIIEGDFDDFVVEDGNILLEIPSHPSLYLPMMRRSGVGEGKRVLILPLYIFSLYSLKEGEELNVSFDLDLKPEPFISCKYKILPHLSLQFNGASFPPLKGETILKALLNHPISPTSILPIHSNGNDFYLSFLDIFDAFIINESTNFIEIKETSSCDGYDFSEFIKFFTNSFTPNIMIRLTSTPTPTPPIIDDVIVRNIMYISNIFDEFEYDFGINNFLMISSSKNLLLLVALKPLRKSFKREISFFLRMALPSLLLEGCISRTIKPFVEKYLGDDDDVDISYESCPPLMEEEEEDDVNEFGKNVYRTCPLSFYKKKEEEISFPFLHASYKEFSEYLKLSLSLKCPFISINGILIHGPSGTGKTEMVMRVLQEERDLFCNLIIVRAIDIIDKYLGSSEENLRKYFEKARSLQKKSLKPVIMLIESIELIGGVRRSGGGDGGGDDSQTTLQTRLLSTLLNELDGVDTSSSKPFLIATTSLDISILDEALIRPGRLDKHVEMKVIIPSEQVNFAKHLGYSIDSPLSECDGGGGGISADRFKQILFNKYYK